MQLKNRIKTILSEEVLEQVTGFRRHLHMFPEASFKEHETSAYIRKFLDQQGVDYQFPFVETGILARITGDQPGKRIALRADMDALPIQEESGLEYSSRNRGMMHACGHDVHMASLMGAVMVLSRMKEFIRGEVLFLFQPGEEKVPGGAKLMIEAGIFDQFRPDMIIAQHVLPELEAGYVGFREGMYMASSDEIYITVKGRGGHAALQQYITDPILMASRIMLALQEEVAAKSPAGVPTVLAFGRVIADGAVNVIPDQVSLDGTFRTMNEEWRKKAHGMIRDVASETASGMGGSCDVEIRHGYPVLENHPDLTRSAMKKAAGYLGEDRVARLDIRMTAEDFAWFARTLPGMMYRLGTGEPGSDQLHPLHTSGFRVEESALETGVSLLSFLALELLNDPPV